jgi:SAM-dependent methyltransferase
MARLASPGRVIAIDLDQPLLQEARAACRGLSNCTFVEGDARNLRELVAEPVDYVLIANTFHGVPDKTELASAVLAVLKPEGRFAVINWYPLPRDQTMVLGKPRGPATAMRMSPDAVREVVEPAGFALERVVELPPYHYGALFAAKPATGVRSATPFHGGFR